MFSGIPFNLVPIRPKFAVLYHHLSQRSKVFNFVSMACHSLHEACFKTLPEPNTSALPVPVPDCASHAIDDPPSYEAAVNSAHVPSDKAELVGEKNQGSLRTSVDGLPFDAIDAEGNEIPSLMARFALMDSKEEQQIFNTNQLALGKKASAAVTVRVEPVEDSDSEDDDDNEGEDAASEPSDESDGDNSYVSNAKCAPAPYSALRAQWRLREIQAQAHHFAPQKTHFLTRSSQHRHVVIYPSPLRGNHTVDQSEES